MTDITELAQREKFEAWVMTQICISKSTLEGLRSADGYRNSMLSGTNYNRMWNCWKAAGAELVEALEKAQAENTAGAAGMAESYETTISILRSRIAELESRTVTVKLPADNKAESQSPEDDASAWFDEGWNARGKADKDALTAQGIKWEAE
ncbi:TPA: hypothetical protein OMU28_003043 [Klebsiella aerogenes]|nr:hypothetical protein [Klebsiella aerogenes]